MSKDEMVQEVCEVMQRMYYEDDEFFYSFVTGYARKKGITLSTIRE